MIVSYFVSYDLLKSPGNLVIRSSFEPRNRLGSIGAGGGTRTLGFQHKLASIVSYFVSYPAIIKRMPRQFSRTPRPTKEGLIPMQNDITPTGFSAQLIARFTSKATKFKEGDCHIWDGAKDPRGYGNLSALIEGKKKKIGAHRIALAIAKPELHPLIFGDSKLIVRHSCDNPGCCNPDHLSVGTHADNVADRVERDRSALGITNGRAVLCEQCVILVRRL